MRTGAPAAAVVLLGLSACTARPVVQEERSCVDWKVDVGPLLQANCARCHTNGYSYGEPKENGGGFYGPRLSEASLTRQFPDKASQIEYVKNGVEDGKAYGTGGVNHWSGGGMPYFANILTDKQIEQIVDYERSL
mgnify:CR=1 FL=1